MNDFDGLHVVVTGATGGLGDSVVLALLERGAICHLPLVERSVPSNVAWGGHDRVFARADMTLTDEASVTGFYADLPALQASIHLVGGFAMAAVRDTRLADLEKMLQLNAVTCFLCCREAVRAMRGGGRIVNVAARPALVPTGGMIAYAASKAAVASITQSLAAECLAEGILVNAVVPSIIDTPANRAAMPGADHASWPKPIELAEMILTLASPRNRLTSGALVPVYGAA